MVKTQTPRRASAKAPARRQRKPAAAAPTTTATPKGNSEPRHTRGSKAPSATVPPLSGEFHNVAELYLYARPLGRRAVDTLLHDARWPRALQGSSGLKGQKRIYRSADSKAALARATVEGWLDNPMPAMRRTG